MFETAKFHQLRQLNFDTFKVFILLQNKRKLKFICPICSRTRHERRSNFVWLSLQMFTELNNKNCKKLQSVNKSWIKSESSLELSDCSFVKMTQVEIDLQQHCQARSTSSLSNATTILGKQNQWGSNPLLAKAYKLLSCSITDRMEHKDGRMPSVFLPLLIFPVRVYSTLEVIPTLQGIKSDPFQPPCCFVKWLPSFPSPQPTHQTFRVQKRTIKMTPVKMFEVDTFKKL